MSAYRVRGRNENSQALVVQGDIEDEVGCVRGIKGLCQLD